MLQANTRRAAPGGTHAQLGIVWVIRSELIRTTPSVPLGEWRVAMHRGASVTLGHTRRPVESCIMQRGARDSGGEAAAHSDECCASTTATTTTSRRHPLQHCPFHAACRH